MNREELVTEIEAIIATIYLIVEHFGLTFKLPIEGDNDEDIKEGRGMFDQHFKFLGSVGLVTEYTINPTSVDVTVSPHIIGFFAEFINEIELIAKQTPDQEDLIIKAFTKMFPQERDHCAECCPYIELDDD